MGKKKNKAKQLNASQAHKQPQPTPQPQPSCPNATASAAVAATAQASDATQPKKRRRRMPKSQRKQLRRDKETEEAGLESEAQHAHDPSSHSLESARAFFSPEHTRKDADPSRRTRNNRFVGDVFLSVLEEVQQGANASRPPTQRVVAASAPGAVTMDGNNNELTSKDRVSTSVTTHGNSQRSTESPSNGLASQALSPPSTLPGATPGASCNYNMANATWNWNNFANTPTAHGNSAQASGYQHQALPPNRQSGAPGLTSGTWGQAFTLMGQLSFPGPQWQVPPPMGHFGYINPTWRAPSRGGLAAWMSPHQRRTMEPTQFRGLATESQTPIRKVKVSGNEQQPGGPKSPKRERPNKPGPPRPDPSPGYLFQSAMMPYRLHTPQPLLIIMDLNGTLLHRPKRASSSKFIQRPFSQAFISYLFAYHTVMVWSSARPSNVNLMCKGLFSADQRKQLVVEWGRDMLGLTQQQYNEKVQVYKQLDKVWQAADTEQWHPFHAHGHRFNQANTLLIDDSVEKAASEPYNLVEVDDFEGKENQMSCDVLREVAGYLEEAKWQSDVSAWVRSGNRFAYGMGWDREWQAEASLAPLPVLPALAPGDHLAQAPSQPQSGRVLRSQTRQQ
ncbi:NLI interacting factor-like phosphatase-domain-containing protein [Phyllosticta citriasiana]|uniref:NLI interacting factor-like phosphatase-domain-containing protein n=1 Tax=Phyllosticta citriasiana TaxID=595635 RepID=UPI0030FD7E83